MEPSLKIVLQSVESNQNYQVVKFIGSLDKAGYADVIDELNKTIEQFNLKFLIFDFADLKFINSEGIGYLMEVHAHLAQRDRKLVLISPNSHVDDVFKAIGIHEIVSVYADLLEFLNSNKS
jgi:anti-anti-sigma factor